MSIGKIYGPPEGAKVLRSVAAAKANGLELEVVPTAPRVDSGKPEFLAKFPMGKVPAFEGADGLLLSESRAIAWYGTYPLPRCKDACFLTVIPGLTFMSKPIYSV